MNVLGSPSEEVSAQYDLGLQESIYNIFYYHAIECENKNLERSLGPVNTIFHRLIRGFPFYTIKRNFHPLFNINHGTYKGFARRGMFNTSACAFVTLCD